MKLKFAFIVSVMVIMICDVMAQCDEISNECTCSPYPESNMVNIVCQFSDKTNLSQTSEPVIINLTSGTQINIHEFDISSNGMRAVPSNIFQGIALIRKLIVRNNSLQSIDDIAIPVAIAESITQLDISENQIQTMDIKKLLDKFPILTGLNVGSNNITAVTKTSGLTNMHVLQHIDLSHNLLDNFDDFLWTTAEHINLSYNMIRVITQIPNSDIQSINLAGNPLNSLASDLFINLHSLQQLILANCSLHTIHINTFKECRSLRALNLSYNELKSLSVDLFKDLVNLISLDISNNMITAIEGNTFNGLQNSVETMILSQNDIKQVMAQSFAKLVELRTLDLHGNSELQNIEAITFPRHLHTLDFSECSINKMNDCYFYELTDLTWFALQGNNLDCSCSLIWLHTFIQHRSSSRQDISQKPNSWTCELENGNKTMINLLNTLCPVQEPHTVPEHCKKAENGTIIEIDLQVRTENKEIVFEWTAINTTSVHGYRVIIKTDGGELFQSTILHRETREYRVKGVVPSSTYSACLEALDENGNVLHEECRNKPYHSYQAIVGILAGVIFLVPCIIVLICIIVKDKKKRREEEYARLENGEVVESEKSSAINIVVEDSVKNNVNGSVKPKTETQKTEKNGTYLGSENKAFQLDNGKQSSDSVPVTLHLPTEKHKTKNSLVTAAIVTEDSTCNTKL